MHRTLTLTIAGAMLLPAPASAQGDTSEDIRQQVAAMQAEIARLSAELAELKAQDDAEPIPSVDAGPAPPSPAVAWKGAPELTAPGGWSFKPRGRLQLDTAVVSAPNAIAGNSLGTATEFRRAFLGVEGTLPGNFGYRIEADFANSAVDLTDVYLTYKPMSELTLTVGQHKPFWGLEEMTSDLFTSMLERAAFNSAFGFERRVGFSGVYAGKSVLVQLGAFTDNAADLNSDSNNGYSLDGRVVFSPSFGDGTLHVGGSAHFRELGDAVTTVRYRARPFTHTTDLRLVDTRALSATGERSFGAELAYVAGPFHATIEGHQITTLRPGLPNPSFRGGYAEAGMLLTRGDSTGYRGGAYDRIRPVNPVTEGGVGAIQLNARYDFLDLTDGLVVGGQQQTAALSLIWMPTDYVRFLLNYGHLWIKDAAVPAGTDVDYSADTVGVRAQLDF